MCRPLEFCRKLVFLLVKKASVYMSAEKPKNAAETLIEAYPLAKMTGIKSRISKVEVEFRKALRELKVSGVKENCDELLNTAIAEGIERTKELLSEKCTS